MSRIILLDEFLFQQLQAPALVTRRRRSADEGDEMRFGGPIQGWLFPVGLWLMIERRLQLGFDEAAAHPAMVEKLMRTAVLIEASLCRPVGTWVSASSKMRVCVRWRAELCRERSIVSQRSRCSG